MDDPHAREVAPEGQPRRLPPTESGAVRPANWSEEDRVESAADSTAPPEVIIPVRPEQINTPPSAVADVEELVVLAAAGNPRLIALSEEVAAAQARAAHADKLPDPTIGANLFAAPIETAAGAQRANLTVMQRIPWLHRLDAQAQQAIFEALALEQVYAVERLKVIADVRSSVYRLEVLNEQIEINQANQQLLQSLIRIANARVAAGGASQGDVLLGSLELSRLSEQLLTLRQQVVSTKAELNRLLGRPAEHPVAIAPSLETALPRWSLEELRQTAIQQQPDIAAARLRVEASRWGVEVARLQRRPDVSLGATWYAIDDNRPTPNIVPVGRDAWSIGVQVSVPIWHRKYDAIQQQAESRHFAAHAGVDETVNRYDALLRDLWEQAKAAGETAQLYQKTILPQAEQTLKADRQTYGTGAVEFDRVIGDLRNVLMLQLEYQRAVGRLSIALARIRQAVGVDLADHGTAAHAPAPN